MKLTPLSTLSNNSLFFGEPLNTSNKQDANPLNDTTKPKESFPKNLTKNNKEWSPITKLALASVAIAKATALSYLAYTYSTPQNDFLDTATSTPNVVNKEVTFIKDFPSTSNQNPATKSIQINNTSEEPTLEPLLFENQFSENIPSSIHEMAAIGLAATIVIAAGSIFAYFKSNSQVTDSSPAAPINPTEAKEKSLHKSPTKENEQSEEKEAEAKKQLQEAAEAQRQQEAQQRLEEENKSKLEEAAEAQRQQEAQQKLEEENKGKLEEAAEAQKQQELEVPVTPENASTQKKRFGTPIKLIIDTTSFAVFDKMEDRKTKKQEQLKEQERLNLIKQIETEYNTYFNIEWKTISPEEFKNKINAFNKLLMEILESEHTEIQKLILPGFIQLLNLSSHAAMEFAIKCLHSKKISCVKVTRIAFTEMIKKYQSVKKRYEDLLENNNIDEDKKTEYAESFERYPSEILKHAIAFAKECRIKKVNYANDNIKALDLVTFQETLSSLLDVDYFSALELIDLFIDIKIREKNPSSTLEEFHQYIISEFEEDADILERYESAYLEKQRHHFNPKRIMDRLNLLKKIEDCLDKENLNIYKAMKLVKANLGNELIEIDDLQGIFSALLEVSPLAAMTLVKHCLDLYFDPKENRDFLKKQCETFMSVAIKSITEIATERKLAFSLKKFDGRTAAQFNPKKYALYFKPSKRLKPVKPVKSLKPETHALKNKAETPPVVEKKEPEWGSLKQLLQKEGDVENTEVQAALKQLYKGKTNILAFSFHLEYLMKTKTTEFSFNELCGNLFPLFEHLHEPANYSLKDSNINQMIDYVKELSDQNIALAMVGQACINNEKNEFLAKFNETYSAGLNKNSDLSIL